MSCKKNVRVIPAIPTSPTQGEEMTRCIIDADDIDRIVINMPLADIDKEIRIADMMVDSLEDGYVKSYWIERLDAYELARDIAEYSFENQIPTVTSKERKDYRITEVIANQRELDGKLNYYLKKVQSSKKDTTNRYIYSNIIEDTVKEEIVPEEDLF